MLLDNSQNIGHRVFPTGGWGVSLSATPPLPNGFNVYIRPTSTFTQCIIIYLDLQYVDLRTAQIWILLAFSNYLGSIKNFSYSVLKSFGICGVLFAKQSFIQNFINDLIVSGPRKSRRKTTNRISIRKNKDPKLIEDSDSQDEEEILTNPVGKRSNSS